MKEQLEMFDLKPDDRVAKLTIYLRNQVILSPFWRPTAKQILEIGEKFGVVGRKPLIILENIWQENITNHGDEPDEC